LLGFETYDQLRDAHKSWLDEALKNGERVREARWSESIAAGREEFVERTKEGLGIRARGRKIREMEGQCELRESEAPYNGHFEAKKSNIRLENTYLWKDYPRILR
jgi:hypothetical protein